MKRSHLALIIPLLVIIIDQTIKCWIKTTYPLGGGFDILGLSWAKVHFVENEGMAFGMQLGGDYGKLLLTLFRIVAVLFIGYYLYTLVKTGASKKLIISIALIFAGAMGNILDSLFYGVIFSSSSYATVAGFMPDGGGYTRLLYGHVVDMFYFPVAQGHYAKWVPLLGGKFYMFFRPVFNVADSAITIGVVTILIFQRNIFSHPEDNVENTNQETILSDPPADTDSL